MAIFKFPKAPEDTRLWAMDHTTASGIRLKQEQMNAQMRAQMAQAGSQYDPATMPVSTTKKLGNFKVDKVANGFIITFTNDNTREEHIAKDLEELRDLIATTLVAAQLDRVSP